MAQGWMDDLSDSLVWTQFHAPKICIRICRLVRGGRHFTDWIIVFVAWLLPFLALVDLHNLALAHDLADLDHLLDLALPALMDFHHLALPHDLANPDHLLDLALAALMDFHHLALAHDLADLDHLLDLALPALVDFYHLARANDFVDFDHFFDLALPALVDLHHLALVRDLADFPDFGHLVALATRAGFGLTISPTSLSPLAPAGLK